MSITKDRHCYAIAAMVDKQWCTPTIENLLSAIVVQIVYADRRGHRIIKGRNGIERTPEGVHFIDKRAEWLVVGTADPSTDDIKTAEFTPFFQPVIVEMSCPFGRVTQLVRDLKAGEQPTISTESELKAAILYAARNERPFTLILNGEEILFDPETYSSEMDPFAEEQAALDHIITEMKVAGIR